LSKAIKPRCKNTLMIAWPSKQNIQRVNHVTHQSFIFDD